jgi:hypothetical protein
MTHKQPQPQDAIGRNVPGSLWNGSALGRAAKSDGVIAEARRGRLPPPPPSFAHHSIKITGSSGLPPSAGIRRISRVASPMGMKKELP